MKKLERTIEKKLEIFENIIRKEKGLKNINKNTRTILIKVLKTF